MKKMTSVLVTMCVFLLNFVSTTVCQAKPGSAKSALRSKRRITEFKSKPQNINSNGINSNGLNFNAGKPIPACKLEDEAGNLSGKVHSAASGLPTGKRQIVTSNGMPKIDAVDNAYGKVDIMEPKSNDVYGKIESVDKGLAQ